MVRFLWASLENDTEIQVRVLSWAKPSFSQPLGRPRKQAVTGITHKHCNAHGYKQLRGKYIIF